MKCCRKFHSKIGDTNEGYLQPKMSSSVTNSLLLYLTWHASQLSD